MDLQLKSRLAPVSGSTAGINHATSHALLREGARLIVNGRTQAPLLLSENHVRDSRPVSVAGDENRT